ncbi:hypothetical protein NDU88_008715 [Pleurodeles waltl]|uniref:Uncharacterized protein n=1 Tax=Pleurodeles waltl TaxID=8319 RepID=A0AAV7P026_PLEWA|nr:hypothetical protein NDU88_008715 [Pleurodeles waltl]
MQIAPQDRRRHSANLRAGDPAPTTLPGLPEQDDIILRARFSLVLASVTACLLRLQRLQKQHLPPVNTRAQILIYKSPHRATGRTQQGLGEQPCPYHTAWVAGEGQFHSPLREHVWPQPLPPLTGRSFSRSGQMAPQGTDLNQQGNPGQ